MQELLTNKTIEKLKYDLVRENLVSYDELSQAEEFADLNSTNLGFALLENKFIQEKKLLEFIEKKLHIPYVNLEDYSLDNKCLKYISEQDARKYRLIPMFKIENVLTVAMADPMDLFVINSIVDELDLKIEPIICSDKSILKAINENYTSSCSIVNEQESSFNWQDELISENIDTSKIREILNAIFVQAIAERQNYIILENGHQGLRVAFGQKQKGIIPALLVPRFISEMKALANMDINVSEIPQLGKYCLSIENKNYSIVVSSFPMVKGERFSLKIYEPPPCFEEFEMTDADRKIIKDKLGLKGIVAIKGDASSGKTLFAYSMLSSLKNKKICTIESKIKYELEGINQSEINEDVGFGVDKALTHINSQDFDVIYFDSIYKSKSDSLIPLVDSGKTVIVELLGDDANIDISCKIAVSDRTKVKVL